jgi:hypothetical protein
LQASEKTQKDNYVFSQAKQILSKTASPYKSMKENNSLIDLGGTITNKQQNGAGVFLVNFVASN